VITLQLNNHALIIPPGADDFRVEAQGTLPNDATLLSFFPHMHVRGKRFEYDIVKPDGSIEPLLRVNYHFHWQLSYRLAEPRLPSLRPGEQPRSARLLLRHYRVVLPTECARLAPWRKRPFNRKVFSVPRSPVSPSR